MPFTSQLIFPQSHSIMSYNIRYDNEWDKVNSWEIRKDEVTKLIYEYDPGIIGIQEGLLNQVQFINNSTTLPFRISQLLTLSHSLS